MDHPLPCLSHFQMEFGIGEVCLCFLLLHSFTLLVIYPEMQRESSVVLEKLSKSPQIREEFHIELKLPLLKLTASTLWV